jgi:hypothetical protein
LEVLNPVRPPKRPALGAFQRNKTFPEDGTKPKIFEWTALRQDEFEENSIPFNPIIPDFKPFSDSFCWVKTPRLLGAC